MLTKQQEKAAKAVDREKYKDYIRDEPYHNMIAHEAEFLGSMSVACGGMLAGLFTALACQKWGIDPALPTITAGLVAGVASGRPLYKKASLQHHLSWLASRDYD